MERLTVRSWFRFSLWPRGRLARERVPEAAWVPRDGRRFSRDVVRIAPVLVTLQVVVAILELATTIAVFELLARLLRSSTTSVAALAALVAARFALSWLSALLGGAVTRAVHRTALARFLSGGSGPLERVQRLLLRDLDLALEGAVKVHKLVALPLGLAGALGFVFASYGTSELLGFAAVALFIPLSLVLGVAGARVLKRVMTASERRIERCTTWTEWAAYLLDWGVRDPLRSIGALFAGEARLRNLDSAIRSSEGYLVAFGRVAPVALAIVFGLVLGESTEAPLAALWIAGPVIAAVLELGRTVAELGQGREAWQEIMRSEDAAIAHDEDIVLGADWDLWTGTVADNLLAGPDVVGPLLVALGLVPELGASVDAVLARPLAARGKTVSAGQRLRLLVARGLVVAATGRRRLVLDVPLTSLDAASRTRVLALVAAPPLASCVCVVPVIAAITDEPLSTAGEGSPARFGWKLAPFALAFVIPAIGLSLSGWVAAGAGDARSLVWLLAIAAGSVAIAVGVGVGFEGRIRAWAGDRVLALLAEPYRWSAADLVQRASRDATTVMERIAWYLHDGAWITALLVVAACGLLVTLHVLGALLVLSTVLMIAVFWRLLLSNVVRARLRSIAATNALPSVGEDLGASHHLRASPVGRSIRTGLVQARFDELLATRLEMALAKLALGRWIELVAGAAVIATAVLLRSEVLPLDRAAFVLTGALAVVQHLLQLFLAFAGFVAQRVSIARLAPASAVHVPPGPTFATAPETIEFAPVSRFGVGYRGFCVTATTITNLRGPSGRGKTQLLRGLAQFGTPGAETDGIYYIDHHWRAISAWAGRPAGAITELLASLATPRVIFLDEPFANDDLATAVDELGRVDAWCRQHGVTAIVVDHRIELPHSVAIADLIELDVVVRAAALEPPHLASGA